MIGRIGLAIARNEPKTVYAVVENANSRTVAAEERAQEDDAGLRRRLDRRRALPLGRRRRDVAEGRRRPRSAGPPAPPGSAAAPRRGRRAAGAAGAAGSRAAARPTTTARSASIPKNKEHVYLLSVGVAHTTDGGKTWTSPFGFGGDNHALWINPTDSDHMLLGHDHGMGVSFDAGRNWLSPDNKPLAQFYAIGYDMEQPYNVYGGHAGQRVDAAGRAR